MKLAPLLGAETIEHDLKSRDRKGVLAELAGLLLRAGLVSPQVDLARVLEEREELGSTGIGEGVAIPHVRHRAVEKLLVALGRSEEGVEFGSVDGKPVHLFFLLVSPEEAAGDHLKALAGISRLLKKGEVRRALFEAGGAWEMGEIIAAEDEKQ